MILNELTCTAQLYCRVVHNSKPCVFLRHLPFREKHSLCEDDENLVQHACSQTQLRCMWSNPQHPLVIHYVLARVYVMLACLFFANKQPGSKLASNGWSGIVACDQSTCHWFLRRIPHRIRATIYALGGVRFHLFFF